MDHRSAVEEDFYEVLKCNVSSSSEQISAEFRLLARRYHPDKVTDSKEREAAEKHFLLLKRARDVLLDVSMRHKYDQWRSGFKEWISFDDWLKMQNRVHTSIHWARNTHTMASLEQKPGVNYRDKGYANTTGSPEKCSEECSGHMEREKRNDDDVTNGMKISSPLEQFRSVGGSLKKSKFNNL